jgi:hypothetical protein
VSHSSAWLAGTLSIAAASCTVAPIQLSQSQLELQGRLPSTYSLASFVELDQTGHRVTVGEKLAELGAYLGPTGKSTPRARRYGFGLSRPGARRLQTRFWFSRRRNWKNSRENIPSSS